MSDKSTFRLLTLSRTLCLFVRSLCCMLSCQTLMSTCQENVTISGWYKLGKTRYMCVHFIGRWHFFILPFWNIIQHHEAVIRFRTVCFCLFWLFFKHWINDKSIRGKSITHYRMTMSRALTFQIKCTRLIRQMLLPFKIQHI